MSTRRQFLGAGFHLAVAASLAGLAARAEAARAPGIVARELLPGMHLLTGAGGNVLAVKGVEGSLLVDGGLARHSKALLRAAARATGSRKVATLINTHWHPAQTGSNEIIGREGGLIVAHEVTRAYLSRSVASVDYEGLYGPLPPTARPAKTTRTEGELAFDGRPVRYGYLPAAHTNGDLYAHFPEQDVLVTGGPVSGTWPLLDWRNGAWLGGLVRAHEKLVSLAGPATRIVPVDGAPISADELKRRHELFATFHQRMVVFQNKGMDSSDILAERPLKAEEDRFGDPTAFIHGAFRSLNLAYSPD